MNRIITITISLLLAAATFAQSVPQTVNFSATVRDANNELLANTPVNVRLTFYENGEGGTPVYCALHQTTTNANGFMSFQLNRNVMAYACNGAPNTPFEEIPWGNGNYWMQVEYQTQIGGDFFSLGYLELTSGFYAFSANYALVAQTLENFDLDGAQDGDVLVYNGTTHKWEARSQENIGGGSSQYSAPIVTTLEATGVTLNGYVSSNTEGFVFSRGFLYGTDADNLTSGIQCSDIGTGSYASILSNLNPNTTYYYKAYATNSGGTGYGDVLSFTADNITSGTFEWVREGSDRIGLDVFGLQWFSNAKAIHAQIKPLDGARLYILTSSDYEINDLYTLSSRLESVGESTVYNGVNVEDSANYNDVIATVYNGRTYLINITRCTVTTSAAGYRLVITGTYKMWE